MNENKKIIKQFSLEDLPLIRQDKDTDNLDFFIAKIGFIASGENRQDCFISEDTLIKYVPTIKGKFVTAKYSWWNDDVMSHEKDLDIIGYVPSDSEITFERMEDGRLMAFCEAVLSKIYCYEVYQLFRKDNYRAVSAEFSCNMLDEDSDTGEIIAINFHSITILGKKIDPAIPNANIKIVKFSKEEADTFYVEQNSSNPLKKFAEDRKKKLENKDVKKSDKSDEEETMKTDKEKEFEKKDTNTEDIVMEDKKEMSDDKTEEKEKEMSDESKEKEKEFEDTQEKADKKQDEKDEKEEKEVEEKEFSDDKKEGKEEEKKFSLKAYVDATATLAMLEKETEERKILANKVLEEMGADKLFSTIMELSKENKELKKYKDDKETAETERKFSSIMAEVKGDIPEDDYKTLYNEGKSLKFSEIDNFGIKVKAFAYEKSKGNNNGDFRIPATNPTKQQNTSTSIEDIYNEYL